MTFDPVDREVYWSGPEGEIAVLTRIGVPVDSASPHVLTVVITIHPEARNRWQATVGMDEGDLEQYEQREIMREQIREREEREGAAMDAIRNTRTLPTAPANAYTPGPVERN